MLHQLLQRVKLGPCSDVIAPAVQLADLVVFDVVALHLVPVPDGEGVGTCRGERKATSLNDSTGDLKSSAPLQIPVYNGKRNTV